MCILSQVFKNERKRSSSEQHLCKSQILKLDVMTEPPTRGGMTVWAGSKCAVMSVKAKIQELGGATQVVTLSADFLCPTHQ